MSKSVYQVVTDQIIDKLEAAEKWQKPWIDLVCHGGVNLVSGKAYRGINTLLIGKPGHWASYKQWSDKKCQVRKGEHGTTVVYWIWFDRENGERGATPRYYTVFHESQVDGFEGKPKPQLPEHERIESCEKFVQGTGARIFYDTNQACYSPSKDEIHSPLVGQFESIDAYYATMFHELTHWTGHHSRCARDLSGRFGDYSYAMEELVAELGSAFLCSALGVSSNPRMDHASYLKSWLKVLKADSKAIFTSASKAQKAADYLLGVEFAEQETEQLAA